MTNQFQSFVSVIQALNKYNVDYILVGGVAVILHGLERLTRVLDVFIRPTLENIDNLKKALHSVFSDSSIEEINSSELEKYYVIRYGTPNGFYIDIMTKVDDTISFEDLEHEIIDYKSIKIKIATPEVLYNLKKDTVRHQDKIDALFLKEIMNARGEKKGKLGG